MDQHSELGVGVQVRCSAADAADAADIRNKHQHPVSLANNESFSATIPTERRGGIGRFDIEISRDLFLMMTTIPLHRLSFKTGQVWKYFLGCTGIFLHFIGFESGNNNNP